jgi:hypothetical protein
MCATHCKSNLQIKTFGDGKPTGRKSPKTFISRYPAEKPAVAMPFQALKSRYKADEPPPEVAKPAPPPEEPVLAKEEKKDSSSDSKKAS